MSSRNKFNRNRRLTEQKHNTLTSFQRYVETLQDEDGIKHYVVDNEGGLHDMSGNIESKIASVDKSKTYWEEQLNSNPKNSVAQKFYEKFTHLKEQIEIWLEGSEVVAHI